VAHYLENHWTFPRGVFLLNLNSYLAMKNCQPLSSYPYFLPQTMNGTTPHRYDLSSQAIVDVMEPMMDLLGGYWVHFLVPGGCLVNVAVVLVL
jgi:hypothetical protein